MKKAASRLVAACCLLVRASHGFAPVISTVGAGVKDVRIPSSSLVPPPIMRNKPSIDKAALGAVKGANGIELAGLLFDSTSTAFDAWEWTANLGAPAALVAGAVLVTLSETREAMQPRKTDKNWVRLAKQWFRFLIMSSFALEVVSIFVSTVTGTVLLSHGEQVAKKIVGYTAPLELLHHHLEFEYLTIQIGFLQGLFNWLVAVALEQLIPKNHETKSGSRMNKCMAASIVTLTIWIQAFYNNHLGFYSDYAHVLKRYCVLFMQRYVLCWPIRPLALLYIPSTVGSLVLAWRAFNSPPDEDDD
mmetsp:Transcript_4620/g.10322  ORF Transcript_4620/g.10322 Transcript_4620/m.10322 type:complete len:303 (-) Transcript_4620:71-979(-)